MGVPVVLIPKKYMRTFHSKTIQPVRYILHLWNPPNIPPTIYMEYPLPALPGLFKGYPLVNKQFGMENPHPQ